MSDVPTTATPAQTTQRKRVEFHLTLSVPHASPPLYDATVSIYDIRRGPKRTKHVNRWTPTTDERLILPALGTWTLETLRLVLWELIAWLPDYQKAQEEEGFDEREWASTAAVTATITLSRSHVGLAVEMPKVGVSAHFDLRAMSEPMRMVLRTLPTVPFPLAGIDSPEGATHGDGDETLSDVELLNGVIATLKELAYLRPKVLDTIDEILQPFRDRLDID